jgi:Protein of unknown function (DUF1553)/Protein of unknown function (DUF1549)
MYGRTNTFRFLSLVMLTGLFGLIVGDLSEAADKKDQTEAAKTKSASSGSVSAKTAGTKLDHAALSRLIDRADDAEFLRRAYLDIVGHIPSGEKAAGFLDSKDPNKRTKLIDELLASSAYGHHMADIWQGLLLVHGDSTKRLLETQPMVSWLEENFNKNKPWNTMVHELLTASGPQDKNGAVTYFLSQGTVDKMTDNVTKVFLGVQLQCAQCHNHPFTEWKQTEYWGMAAFFLRTQPTANIQKASKAGEALTVVESNQPKRGKNALPESAKILPPKFLAGDNPKVGAGPLRPVLADWMTTAKNPFFGKAMVNRMWAQFMGRGLVNPVDDMHDGNAASHPQLLAELTEQFTANDFDVKFLIRAICNSAAYQRTSKPNSSNKEASPAVYSRMAVKMMTGEQLVDSIIQVVGTPPAGAGGRGKAAGKAPGTRDPRANLVAFFGGEEGADVTEYQDGIPQVLRLMNGPALNRSPKLMALVKTSKSPVQAIEQIYLATLGRRPKPDEMNTLTAYVKKVGPDSAYGDLLWAVMNSSEFRVNR